MSFSQRHLNDKEDSIYHVNIRKKIFSFFFIAFFLSVSISHVLYFCFSCLETIEDSFLIIETREIANGNLFCWYYCVKKRVFELVSRSRRDRFLIGLVEKVIREVIWHHRRSIVTETRIIANSLFHVARFSCLAETARFLSPLPPLLLDLHCVTALKTMHNRKRR